MNALVRKSHLIQVDRVKGRSTIIWVEIVEKDMLHRKTEVNMIG